MQSIAFYSSSLFPRGTCAKSKFAWQINLTLSPLLNLPRDRRCRPTFSLHVLSCLQGLQRASQLGWFGDEPLSNFDVEEYQHFDDPKIFNLNQITPKFVAFIGPERRTDDKDWTVFQHTPPEYVGEFLRRGVSTVIRLNQPDTYDKCIFTDAGIDHIDLEFADCTTPSAAIVERFLDIVDAAKGIVAIHCLAGLGRTGTLIALHMMKHDGFPAREAIGTVRLMRPGSIIGPQQMYLLSMQDAQWIGNMPVSENRGPRVDEDEARVMAAQVARAVGKTARGEAC